MVTKLTVVTVNGLFFNHLVSYPPESFPHNAVVLFIDISCINSY